MGDDARAAEAIAQVHSPDMGTIGVKCEMDEGSSIVERAPLSPVRMNGHGVVETRLDRDRLCNDILNTGVMASLIGGFAMGNLGGKKVEDKALPLIIYCLNVVCVHACTCSALMGAFLYNKANGLHEEDVTAWAQENAFLLSIPMKKFAGGCICYLVAVLMLSYQQLENNDIAKFFCLMIGVMSVGMVFMTTGYLMRQKDPNYYHKKDC